jgi:chlorophyllide a hydrolase
VRYDNDNDNDYGLYSPLDRSQTLFQSLPDHPGALMPLSPPVAIYLYWALGLGAGLLWLRQDILSPNLRFDARRIALLSVSLALVAINAVVYTGCTADGGRTLDPLSVAIFSLGNGIAETIWFYAFFRLGEGLASRVVASSWIRFACGLLALMIYSGLIHSLFWMSVLPEQTLQSTALRPFLMPVLTLIAVSWSLAFFWYRDLHSVALLHALVDLTLICNVKFSMLG